MRIITSICSECGTVIAANELEKHRVMKCPGLTCENVLRFGDLRDADREYFLEHRNRYRM